MLALNILFIGGGNMAEAIIAGLILNGYDPRRLSVIDRNNDKCKRLIDKYKINAGVDIGGSITADIIFLAVKPQSAKYACSTLKEKLLDANPLIISVMAGVTTTILSQWLGEHLAIVRAMPNTPAVIQSGITGLFANSHVLDEHKTTVEILMQAVGQVVWLTKETDMDIVTALSGSGPAYYYFFMECMQKAAVKMGISVDIAHLLVSQTAYGAAKLAMESDGDFEQLRVKVTSKGGTTAAAVNIMIQRELDETVSAAIEAARQRSIELSKF